MNLVLLNHLHPTTPEKLPITPILPLQITPATLPITSLLTLIIPITNLQIQIPTTTGLQTRTTIPAIKSRPIPILEITSQAITNRRALLPLAGKPKPILTQTTINLSQVLNTTARGITPVITGRPIQVAAAQRLIISPRVRVTIQLLPEPILLLLITHIVVHPGLVIPTVALLKAIVVTVALHVAVAATAALHEVVAATAAPRAVAEVQVAPRAAAGAQAALPEVQVPAKEANVKLF